MPDETPFTPEEIDEQLDRSLQALHAPHHALPLPPEQQVIGELHALYAAETETLQQAIARGRARLAQQHQDIRAAHQPRSLNREQTSVPSERHQAMQPLLKLVSQRHGYFSRLGGLAAAALLIALVGSLVAGLVLVRLNKPTTISQPQTSLKGGVEISLIPTCDGPAKHCAPEQLQALAADSAILKGRIADGLGIAQPVVRQQGSDEIIVDLPPQVRTQDALDLLTPVAKLEIIDTGPQALTFGTVVQPGQYPVRFTGDQLDPRSIQAIIEPQRGQPVVTFQLKSQEQSAFAAYIQQNIYNYLTILMDGKVIASSVITTQTATQPEIKGLYFTLADAQQAAAIIRNGSLPVPLTVVEKQTITT
jgi:hypothetical protein